MGFKVINQIQKRRIGFKMGRNIYSGFE